jgi:polyphosphate kinase 2 (PPK2 family)
VSPRIWAERFEDIVAFERHLVRNGVVVLKFFLHVSKEEQQRRFLERLDTPAKNWKFSVGDVRERQCWRDYMAAYEDMIRHTATPEAPWHVVPADHKWFTRLVVAGAIAEQMKALDLAFPAVDRAKRKELAAVRAALSRPRS